VPYCFYRKDIGSLVEVQGEGKLSAISYRLSAWSGELRSHYLIAMVAEFAVSPPTVIESGYVPGASVVGTTMFICTRPMKPGARPAKETWASAEPILAERAEVMVVRTLPEAETPSVCAGETGPEPVR